MGMFSFGSSKKKRKYGQGGSAQYQQRGFLSGLGFGSFSSSARRRQPYPQQGYAKPPVQAVPQAAPAAAAPAGAACAQCGAALPAGAKFCLNCGAKAEPAGGGFCAQCGGQLPAGAKFCPSCGTPRA